MFTGLLQVFHVYVYALLYPKATHSFMTTYIVVDFGVSPEILAEPSSFYTLVSSSVISRKVYKNLPIIVYQRIVDIVKLEMTDFEVIFASIGSILAMH